MQHDNSVEQAAKDHSVHIIVNGQPYGGTYTVDGPTVTVNTLLLGAKRARLGDTAPEHLAKLLLAELVYDRPNPCPDLTQSGLHSL